MEPLDRGLGLSRPVVADTKRSDPTVYIGSKDQSFYALDAETGEVRWQKDIGGVVLGAASVLGEVVYVAGLGPNIGTFGFDVKTGKKVFEYELGEYNPVISDGRRMYLTGSSNIRAFEHETKAERRSEAHRRRGSARRRPSGSGGSGRRSAPSTNASARPGGRSSGASTRPRQRSASASGRLDNGHRGGSGA